ncbi:MAG: trigger factor [Candidatus Saccharibacteria bacterium]|nr:trigger factor [Candidatus Saccharibacteria bacterium]
MKTTVKKLSDTKVEIKITLDAKDLAPAKKQAIEHLAKDVKVEGFRKGKVPTDVAAKFIPDNDLNAEALDFAVRLTVIQAFSDNKQSLISLPQINVIKYVPDETLEYTATADVLPEVKLCDYKNLKVKKEAATVAKKDIDDVLKNIAKSYAEKKAVKRAAKEGDEVIIDFVGKKDGEAFKGGTAKDYRLPLGSHTFIPGFEEGIVGHEPGDKFDLNLTFPKDYGMKDLAGAKTVFEVLLKQVNEVKEAALDDELAKKCGPFKTLKELEKDIEKNLAMQNEYRLEEKYKDDLIKAVVEKSKIPTPEILIKDQLRLIEDDITRNAASHNLTFEDYLAETGQTREDWEKAATKTAEDRVKASLALQIIARDNKITVKDELVEAKLAELRDVYKNSKEALENLKDPNVAIDIRNRLIIEETINFLVKANKK